MQHPLVTISIPIYNCHQSLEMCLESVRLQIYDNIEVLLINDVTPDHSVSIAEHFIQKHQLHNWKIRHLDSNCGLSVVRNVGIQEATGKYIFFLDSDDTISDFTIYEMVTLAEKTEAQMVVGEVMAIKLPENTTFPIFPITLKENIIYGNDLVCKAYLDGQYPESSWNKLIRLDFLRKHQLYFTPGLYAQDSLHSFEVALKLESLAALRKQTYQYYLHENSVIHNRGKRHFDNWFTIAQKLDYYLKKEKSPSRKNQILKYLLNYKINTLQMNWKAKRDKVLWLESYKNYQKLSTLGFMDYFSKSYSTDLKKKILFISLPPSIGFSFFKWRYER